MKMFSTDENHIKIVYFKIHQPFNIEKYTINCK